MLASFTLSQCVKICQQDFFTRWEFDTDMQRFKARHSRSQNFENMLMSFYQETRPECKIESFFSSGKQKENNVDGY